MSDELPSAVGPSRGRPWTLPPSGITAVCVGTALAAAAAMVGEAVSLHGQLIGSPVAFVALTLLLGYTHVRPTRLLHSGGTVDSDHLDDALFVPMVLLLNSVEVGAAVAIASLAGNLAARRAPVKVMFNVGQTVLACLAGFAVAHGAGAGPHLPVTARVLVGCCAGGVVFAALSAAAVAVIVRLAAGHPLLPGLREQWAARGIASVGALLLGVVAGVAAHDHPLTAVPAVAAAWTVERAYVAIVVQRQARLAAEALQAAVVAVRNSHDPDEVRRRLVDAAAQVLHAGYACVVETGSPSPHGALRVRIDDDEVLQVADRIGGGSWLDAERDALTTLATVGGEALESARLLAQLTAITDGQSEAVLATAPDGTINFANPAARRLLGSAGALVGRPADDVFFIERSHARIDLLALASSHSGLRDDDAVLWVGDERIPIAFTAAGLPAPGTGVVVVLHDITERKAFEERLTYMAFHDPLTDLPNRRLFEDRLDHALARARRDGQRHALLIVDLDRFKLVNDSYGHPVGDDLLIQVASCLTRSLRPGDTCARLGGDEFAILIEDVTDVGQVVRAAERILEAFANDCFVGGRQVYVSASVGIATSDQAPSRQALVAAADAAGYEAKAAGNGRIRVFTHGDSGNARARLELESALRHAIERREFELFYQPIVDGRTGEILGAEALVRWHAAEGLVLPFRFIPLAEETGLIVPLGAWVLEEACRQAQEWNRVHPDRPALRISVNLSAQQLGRPEVVSEIGEVLARTGVAPGQLCLEVTESVIMNDAEAAIAMLEELKALGVMIAIDDFGTGYSSLSYLKRFPLDVVKIDRTFTSGLGENPIDSEIVAAVVRLAAARGVLAIAEGVETTAQRDALNELGCPLIQGFLVARPLDATGFAELWDASVGSVPASPVGASSGSISASSGSGTSTSSPTP